MLGLRSSWGICGMMQVEPPLGQAQWTLNSPNKQEVPAPPLPSFEGGMSFQALGQAAQLHANRLGRKLCEYNILEPGFHVLGKGLTVTPTPRLV